MNRSNDQRSDHAADARLSEAMAYVLDELSPAEQEAFERRLIDDQDLRDAVVEVVGLCETVTSLQDANLQDDGEIFPLHRCATNEDSRRDVPERLFAWGAVALAASVMLAVVVAGLSRSRSMVGSDDKDAQAQLAVVWANTPSLSERSEGGPVVDDVTGEAMAIDDAGALIDESPDGDDEDENGLDLGPADGGSPTDNGGWMYEALTDSRLHPALPPTTSETRG